MIPDGFTVVAGSLGDQGGAAARTLKLHSRHVRALSRNRWSAAAGRLLDAGIEVLNDDLERPQVVVRDLAGAAEVFGALTPYDQGGLEAELRQVRNLAWAAVRAGVERFVFASVGDPEHDGDTPPDGLWSVEELLRQFELPLTILRPALFMEDLDEYALRRGPGGGLVLRTPLPANTAAWWISMEDVGALVRTALDDPRAFGSRPLTIAAEQLRLAEMCTLLGEVLGEPVRYEQIAFGEVKDRHARGMYRWFQSTTTYEADVKKLRRLHPGLLSFRGWLENGGLDLDKVEHGSAAAA
jgi:uncharacterized protein YbjT (DUF2867 family)